jgi:hypothetical protein
MFKKDRADFEAKWDDLKIFVEYGTLSDDKFAAKAKEFSLLKIQMELALLQKNTKKKSPLYKRIRTEKLFSCTQTTLKINLDL